MTVTLYHNPRCSKSREALARLQAADVELEVVEYLKTPLDKSLLQDLAQRSGLGVRGIMRTNEAIYKELGLADADDGALLEAVVAHPILLNRPIMVTQKGVRLGRPVDLIDEVL